MSNNEKGQIKAGKMSKRNKFIIAGLAGAILIGGAIAVGASTNNPSLNDVISVEEARNVALGQYEGSVIDSIELDRNLATTYYEVDLDTETLEVELKIDAFSGEVISVREENRDEWEFNSSNNSNGNNNATTQTEVKATTTLTNLASTVNENQKATNSDNNTENTNTQSSGNNQGMTENTTIITEADAIAIAEKETGTTVSGIHLDYDDGRQYYDVYLQAADYQIELEIDAVTGTIVESDYDSHFDD